MRREMTEDFLPALIESSLDAYEKFTAARRNPRHPTLSWPSLLDNCSSRDSGSDIAISNQGVDHPPQLPTPSTWISISSDSIKMATDSKGLPEDNNDELEYYDGPVNPPQASAPQSVIDLDDDSEGSEDDDDDEVKRVMRRKMVRENIDHGGHMTKEEDLGKEWLGDQIGREGIKVQGKVAMGIGGGIIAPLMIVQPVTPHCRPLGHFASHHLAQAPVIPNPPILMSVKKNSIPWHLMVFIQHFKIQMLEKDLQNN